MKKTNLPLAFLLLAWAAGITAVIAGGFVLDGYATHSIGLQSPQPYPYEGVCWFCLTVTVEVLALSAIVRPVSYRSSWGRALLALVMATALAAAHAMGLMHAPTYQSWHALWLFLVWIGLAFAAVVAAFSTLRARIGQRS